MAALGELIVIIIIYLLLGIIGVGGFLLVCFLDSKLNILLRIGLILVSLAPILLFYFNQVSNKRESELNRVGIYILSEYPNCDSCIIELKENMIYQITGDGFEYETGNWNYESGGDFWITYLENEEQLGSGIYQYDLYDTRSRSNF